MNRTIVESATLATIVYDGDRELLQLEFRSREIYKYFGVPAAVALSADGRRLHENESGGLCG